MSFLRFSSSIRSWDFNSKRERPGGRALQWGNRFESRLLCPRRWYIVYWPNKFTTKREVSLKLIYCLQSAHTSSKSNLDLENIKIDLEGLGQTVVTLALTRRHFVTCDNECDTFLRYRKTPAPRHLAPQQPEPGLQIQPGPRDGGRSCQAEAG